MTMQYMLMFFESEQELAKREDPQAAEAYWGAWRAYVGMLAQSGAVVNGDGLHPPRTATRVSLKAGKRQVQDGPVPEAKEHLGGYFVIEAKDLSVAIDWAAKAPNAADGYTEVRPVLPPAAV
jgi:hypothetical protein